MHNRSKVLLQIPMLHFSEKNFVDASIQSLGNPLIIYIYLT